MTHNISLAREVTNCFLNFQTILPFNMQSLSFYRSRPTGWRDAWSRLGHQTKYRTLPVLSRSHPIKKSRSWTLPLQMFQHVSVSTLNVGIAIQCKGPISVVKSNVLNAKIKLTPVSILFDTLKSCMEDRFVYRKTPNLWASFGASRMCISGQIFYKKSQLCLHSASDLGDMEIGQNWASCALIFLTIGDIKLCTHWPQNVPELGVKCVWDQTHTVAQKS